MGEKRTAEQYENVSTSCGFYVKMLPYREASMSGITIRDVARESGVSITTVSRVINGVGYVKESTRSRVQEAVRSLGFRPNHLARSLSSGSTKIIGAVFPDISDPFFPAVARGIDDALASRGYMLVICNTDNDARQEEALVGALLEKRVDGIVFVTGSPELGPLVKRASEQVPVSLIDREIQPAYRMGAVAAEMLLERIDTARGREGG